MSDSRSCGRCIYYNSITNECGEESKCQRDVDEAKYTSYIEGKKQGRADAEKELQGLKDLGKLYSEIRAEAIDECIALFKEYQPRLATHVSEFGDALEQLKENNNG